MKRMIVALLVLLTAFSPGYTWTHGAASSPTTLGLGLNRGEIPSGVQSITAPFTSQREHYVHPDGGVTSCKTVDTGWYASQGNAATNADTRTIKRYLYYSGTYTQVTWNGGQTSVTIPAGTAEVTSDVFSFNAPASGLVLERTVNLTSTVANFPTMYVGFSGTNAGLGLLDGNASGDLGNSGTITASDSYSFGAAAFVCTISATNARSFAIVGDSIPFGYQDTSIGAFGGLGWVEKMLDVHGYPYSRYAIPSLKTADVAANMTKPQAFFNAISFSDAVQELGINDLLLGSETVATVLADQQTIYGLFGSARVFQTTMLPVTTSSNFWQAPSDQTFNNPVTGTLGLLNTLNDAIRLPQAGVYRVLDAADVAMTSRNSDIWTTPPIPTDDGIHAKPPMTNTLATSLAPHL